MTPETILLTVQSVANAATEYLKWIQTDEGRKWSAQVMADRQAWDKFWTDAGKAIGSFVKGDTFK
jgi:hypothetical protein